MKISKDKRTMAIQKSKLARAIITAISAYAIVPYAHALEIGQAQVQSAIGERMRILVPIAGATGADGTCVTARFPGAPGLTRSTSIQQGSSSLVISSKSLLREPILEMRLSVGCSGQARLTRDYVLFIDPPSTNQVAQLPTAIAREALVPAARTRVRRARVMPTIGADTQTYRVQRGDSLSAIAQRIDRRDMTNAQIADVIFAANTHAFGKDNPDLLLAGSVLTLPASTTTAQLATTDVLVEPIQSAAQANSAARNDMPIAQNTVQQPDSVQQAWQFNESSLVTSSGDAASSTNTTTVEDAAVAGVVTGTSPFKTRARSTKKRISAPVEANQAGPTTDPIAGERAASINESVSVWTDRIKSMLSGAAIALLLWASWNILQRMLRSRAHKSAQLDRKRPRSRKATPIPDFVESTNVMFNMTAADSAIQAPTHASRRFAEAKPQIDVQTLDVDLSPSGNTPLTDQAADMLAQDYEQEFTQTQQFARDVAERALQGESEEIVAESTIEYGPVATNFSLDLTDDLFNQVTAATTDTDSHVLLDDEATAAFPQMLHDDLDPLDNSSTHEAIQAFSDSMAVEDDSATMTTRLNGLAEQLESELSDDDDDDDATAEFQRQA